jgi:hypothetical protein
VLLNTISLDLEHSLLSLSKWESKFQKPFIDPRAQKSPEEVFGYLQAMVITPGVDLDVLYKLTQDQINEIQNYVDSSQSATTFGKLPDRRGPGETITSELIYYWLATFNLPFDPCETWHLNRLFALIRICGIKNSKDGGPRMSRSELAQRNRELNMQRRKELGTKG